MGYSIEYGASGPLETAWRAGRKKQKRRNIIVIALGIIILALLFSGQIRAVQDFMIPGNPDVTRAAFAQFTEDLRLGTSFSNAINTFCREIIDHASVPE